MQRYEHLRAWALRLVLGDRQQAEDLLHDAFIHFTLHRSLIENVQNLDAYLYTMLRNLHLSQARRLARTPQGHLSLLDYDSADIGLQSIDPRDQIKVQDELRMICRYSCIRKQTSKAGSVLILRFFHGYYPAEIARILNSPRAAVDSFLKGARSEAKLFLQNPEGLTFIRDDVSQDLPTFSFGRVASDILAELRQRIFSSRRDRCLSQEQLQALYTQDATELIDVDTLNHLVSCVECLDDVNKRLGLPPLSARQASETIGRDRRPKDGGGGGPAGGGPAGATFLKRGRRRTKQVFEHRPKELHISVNGFVLGTQTISSRRSELTLNVNLDEKIAFVEVFSERDVRLFFLNVEIPPEGSVDQLSSIELSDGRALDLALNFSETWPRLHAVYVDPMLDEVGEADSERETSVPKSDSKIQTALDEDRGLMAKARFLGGSVKQKAKDLRHLILDFELFTRPAVVTLLLATVLLGSLFILRMRTPVQPITPAGLLRQASTNEQAVLAKPNQVIHQTITLEERRSPGGELIVNRRIEVWQSADRGIEARRLYDERNALIAGDWRRSDGVQTLYHHGVSPRIQLAPEKRNTKSLHTDDFWQLSLSAKDFSAVVGSTDATHVEERPDTYVIAYENGSQGWGAGRQGVIRAALTLSKQDLHATELTLLVRGDDSNRKSEVSNPQLVEFRFIETSFERKSASAVSPVVFDPEPELLSSTRPETPNSKPETTATAPGPQPSTPVIASAALEVEVLRLLNQAGADMGEQVTVTRTREGLLHVDGVVDNAQRKTEILRALGSVNDPALHVQVVTVEEALKKRQAAVPSSPIAVEGTNPSANSIPADAEVRRYFSGRGLSGAQLEEGISGFANQALNRSLKIMQHAWALKRLAARFSPEELRALDPEARSKWLALIKQHAQALAQQNESLRHELLPVFPVSGSSDDTGEGIAISNDDDLVLAIERLFEVCSGNDRVVRQAFAITPDGSKDSTIKSPQFWRALRNTEKIAQTVGRSP